MALAELTEKKKNETSGVTRREPRNITCNQTTTAVQTSAIFFSFMPKFMWTEWLLIVYPDVLRFDLSQERNERTLLILWDLFHTILQKLRRSLDWRIVARKRCLTARFCRSWERNVYQFFSDFAQCYWDVRKKFGYNFCQSKKFRHWAVTHESFILEKEMTVE